MKTEDIEQAADALFTAEVTGKQVGIISLVHPDLSMDDAYAIQARLVERKRAAGRSLSGWKIGLPSKAMQYALNIDTPDSGILFDDMVFASGATVPRGRFIEPRVEAEIAFVLKAPLHGENVTARDVIAATDYVTPALEILDTRIERRDAKTGRARKIVDTIADNAANAGIVTGNARHAIDDHDLRWVGAIVSRDGDVEETGLGAGVLNDPVESVVWLVRRLARYGQSIEAGHVVLSGSFIRPIECPPGSTIAADFGHFGSVDISFA